MAKVSSVRRLPSGGLKYNGETYPGYNKPVRQTRKAKSMRVLAKKGDEVKKVTFGDPDMPIRKGNKAAKASYCARSGGIKGKNDKFSANYWSRKAWDC